MDDRDRTPGFSERPGRRGQIARLAVIYLGVAWVLVQVANTLEEALELPAWFDRFTTIAVIAGFPVALLVGFLHRPRDEEETEGSGGASAKPIATSGDGRPSIAVLPFVNLSDDREREYFADGMTDDIITGLSAGRHIAVKSRSSTFAYKGKTPDAREVAAKLGVGYVVEGSVRSVGDRVRITVQLVMGETGDQLWAQRFDRPAAELFEIQDEVIASITSAVGATLAKSESIRAASLQPQSLSVWQAVQRASFYRGASGNSEEDTNQSIEELRRATREEPEYAYAHSMLAWMLLYRAVNALSDEIGDDFREAKRHLTQGLALAPDDPFNLNICGGAYSYSGDADRGEELCLKALSIDPNFADVHFNLSLIYRQQGRFEEASAALDEVERAAPEGPISRYYEWYRASLLMAQRDYSGAEPLLRVAIAKAPAYTTPYVYLMVVLIAEDREEEAKEVAERVLSINPRIRDRNNVSLLHSFPASREFVERAIAMLRETDPAGPSRA